MIPPILSEKMIEKYIDDDPGEATSFGGEQEFRFEKNRMSVGEGIDHAMEHDAFDKVRRIDFQQSLLRTAHEISQQSTGAGGIGGVGEVEVSEEVQGLRA